MEYPVIDVKTTGSNIKNLCREKNITVKEISDYMNFSNVQSVYNWFNGKTMPSLDNFYALSRLLEVPMEEMITASDRKSHEVLSYTRKDVELKKSA